jgi:PAS domain S-box-containing protein
MEDPGNKYRFKKREYTDEEIHRKLQQLEQAESLADMGSWYLDLENDDLYWSPRLREILDYEPEEPITVDDFTSPVHPEDKQDVQDALQAALDQKKPYNLELRVVVNDKMKWVHAVGDVNFDEEDNPTGVIGVVQDISESKRRESRLKKTKQKYESVFKNTGTATCIIEEDNTISLANRTFAKLTGYSLKEIEGKKRWTEFVAEKDVEKMREYHQNRRYDNGDAPNKYEFDLIDKSGDIHRIDLTVELIPGTNKSVASLNDVTELKQARERYATIFENTGTAMILIGEDGKIKMANKRLSELCGCPKEDIIDKKSWEDFATEDNIELLKTYRKKRLNNEPVPENYDIDLVDAQGKIHTISLTADLLPGTKQVIASLRDITERKEAEERARIYQRGFASSPNSMVFVEYKDGEPVIRDVNKGFERIYGYSKEEAIGSNPNILNSGKQNKAYYKKMWSRILDPAIGYWQDEIINKTKDGKLVNVLLTISGIFDGKDEPEYFMAHHVDVTERTSLENAMRAIDKVNAIMVKERDPVALMKKSAEALIAKPEYACVMIALFDDEGNIDTTHHASQIQCDDKNITSEYSNEYIQKVKLEGYLEIEDTADSPFPVHCYDEKGHAGMAVLLEAEGKPYGVLTIHLRGGVEPTTREANLVRELANNIGFALEHIHTHERHNRTRNAMRTIVDRAPYGIYTVDKSGDVQFVNEAMIDITGDPREQVEKFNVLELEGYQRIGMDEKIRNVIEKNKPFYAERVKYQSHLGGKTTYRNMTGIPMHTEGVAAMVFVEDITERIEAELQVSKLNKLKSRFINALTHVTRTPLTKVRWAVETLLSGSYGKIPDKQQVFLRQILDSNESVLRLIRNMNTTLDIERDALTLEKSPTSISSLASSAIGSHKPHCEAKGIDCNIEAEQSLPAANVDPERIRQVLDIVIDNAERYTKKDGEITLSVEKDGEFIRVSVQDDGVGIPESEQGNVFDRFFRASNAATMHPDGVGLGLHIAKHIVKTHGGEMNFESTEGEGSTFWFTLPIA